MTDTALILAPRSDLVTVDPREYPSQPDPSTRWERAAHDWLLGRRSERTRRAYADAWTAFLAHVARPPWSIERAHVIAYRDALVSQGKSEATICQALAALSSFYRFCQAEGLTDRNPCQGVQRPRVRPYDKARYITGQQARQVLAVVDTSTPAGRRDRAILALFLTMGLRRAELAALRRGDVTERPDGVAVLTYTPKGKARETREIPATAWRALRVYLADRGELGKDAPVFVAHDRAADYRETHPLTAEAIRLLVAKHTTQATGQALNPHGLRHSAATLLYKMTGDRRAVQELLGHTRASTTDIYLHRLDDRRAQLGDLLGAELGV